MTNRGKDRIELEPTGSPLSTPIISSKTRYNKLFFRSRVKIDFGYSFDPPEKPNQNSIQIGQTLNQRPYILLLFYI